MIDNELFNDLFGDEASSKRQKDFEEMIEKIRAFLKTIDKYYEPGSQNDSDYFNGGYIIYNGGRVYELFERIGTLLKALYSQIDLIEFNINDKDVLLSNDSICEELRNTLDTLSVIQDIYDEAVGGFIF